MGDWSSTSYITSQIFISVSYILLAFTYFIKQREKQLLTVIACNITMGSGFALLGGWVAVSMCAIAILRDVSSSIINANRPPKDQLKNTKLDWYLLILWISLFSVSTYFTQTGFMTLFAYFATITFTISIWQKNQFNYKLLGIFVGIFWIIYNVIVQSFMGTALESILLLFVIYSLIIYCKKQN